MTRPRKQDAYIGFWCSPALQEEITAKAASCEMSRSDFIRSCMTSAVDAPTPVPHSGPYCTIAGPSTREKL